MHYEITIIVPTLNERGNIIPLYKEIQESLKGIKYEILFVDDDSSDGTLDIITGLSNQYENIRYIRRVGKKGLSSACIEGFASINDSEYIGVIDADLQHDPRTLQHMLSAIKNKNLDIVIASRFKKKSSHEGLSVARQNVSKVGNLLCYYLSDAKFSDPLSGYFLVKKSIIDKMIYCLSGKGFKILLDIFCTAKQKKIKLKYLEVPTDFRNRLSGESKLEVWVALEFLNLILEKKIGKIIPTRFLLFILVGGIGLVFHMLILWIFISMSFLSFSIAQSMTTFIVMTNNFFLNNLFTFRDKKIKGVVPVIKGLATFYLSCLIGAFFNVLTSTYFFEKGMIWLVAGFVGCVVGSVWNYAISSILTWGKRKS